MRYIVAIRRPEQPQCYYLSKRGLRCYLAQNVAVFQSRAAAESERDYFAKDMTGFILSVEQLPAGVRNVGKALLRAVPV